MQNVATYSLVRGLEAASVGWTPTVRRPDAVRPSTIRFYTYILKIEQSNRQPDVSPIDIFTYKQTTRRAHSGGDDYGRPSRESGASIRTNLKQ